MNIHEYQAKAVLREFGVPVPRGIPALSVEEGGKAANELGGPVWVVKAQIHAGGRGKAGGVKVVKSVDDVKREAERLLGSTLVTHQTGPHGKEVHRLYIEEGSSIDREYYLSALVDRATSRIAFVASTEGGMDIEEVARTHPEKISQLLGRSGDRLHGASRPRGRARARIWPRSRQAGRERAAEALSGVPRQGHEPARDQSAGRHQGGRARLPRRQDRLRRQRALPSSRYCRLARSDRRGRQGDRGLALRPQLCRARRHHRLHGQRRRPRHGDHGHHQALWRNAGEFSRRRRRRQQGQGDRRVQDHYLRSAS